MSRIKVENIRHPDGTGDNISLTDTGRVGIGTASPAQQLHIAGSTGGAVALLQAANDTAASVLQFGDTTSTLGQIRYEHSSDALSFYSNNSEAARFDSSGRLLVGTSTARSDFFKPNGNTSAVQIEGTSAASATFSVTRNSNNAAAGYIILGKSRGTTNGSNTILQNNDDIGRISFQGTDGAAPTEAAFIAAEVDGTPGANDMPGRLVFSTTADGASTPTERVRITDGGESFTYAEVNGWNFRTGSSANTSNTILQGAYGATSTLTGTTSVFIYSNGNVVNTNNSYGSLSDIKLKENIVDASSQWDDLKALQVRNYNFKEGQTHTQIGLIAQEVELVSPGLVSESPDLDAEGNDLGTVTKSVNYSVLYMKAIKALQEAQLRIEQLETQNASFEARLSALEGGQP